MRVLMFAPNYLPATRYGGPIRSAHGLAKSLVERGHEVSVFTTNVDGPGVLDVALDTPISIDGVQVRYFETVFPRRIYYSPCMARRLTEEVPRHDVVHTNGVFLWPGPRTAATALKARVPYIVSPRGMLVPQMIEGKSRLIKHLWLALMESRYLQAAATIHATSQEEAEGVRASRYDLAPIRVVANGIEQPKELPTLKEIEAIWAGVPEGGQRVAFLGRLDWTKGIDLAIEAVRLLPSAQLLIAGPDQIGLRAKLEPRLHGNGGRIFGRFIGPVGDAQKWALLMGADVLLAPSVKESFGIAVGEALSVGTAVICTEGVGAAGFVRRIDAGCVVRREVEALAAALAAMLSDSIRRRRFGEEAKRIVKTELTWAKVAQEMEAIYEVAIGERAT